ncbi:MAG: hypothetical protein QOF19_2378, partial [Alphaproteobacteria bacterium]|nr:hypothetical protein [Alphaproteobacteria bacterium]
IAVLDQEDAPLGIDHDGTDAERHPARKAPIKMQDSGDNPAPQTWNFHRHCRLFPRQPAIVPFLH